MPLGDVEGDDDRSGARSRHTFREGLQYFGLLWLIILIPAALIAAATSAFESGRLLFGIVLLAAAGAVTVLWAAPRAQKEVRRWHRSGSRRPAA